MDFQATRRMFEANAGGSTTPEQFAKQPKQVQHKVQEREVKRQLRKVEEKEVPVPRWQLNKVEEKQPSVVKRQSYRVEEKQPQVVKRQSQKVEEKDPPVVKRQLQKVDSVKSDHSSYSDIGDYAQDEEFYVPGVNDPQDDSMGLVSMPMREPTSTTVTESTENKRGSTISAGGFEIEGEIGEGSEDDEGEGFSDDEEEMVRQHSNFSRLSAESWMSVDSAQDVLTATMIVTQQQREPNSGVKFLRPEPASPMLKGKRYTGEDRDPVGLFGEGGQVVQALETKRAEDMSVLECCAVLQIGFPAYKRKSLRRFGARRAWLSADCSRLCWTSKKDGGEDYVKLQKVARLRVEERLVSVDSNEGYRLTLLFRNENMANIWARALSCLIPLQSRIRAPRGVLLSDKDREDFTLTDDSFDGKALQAYMAVNSYVVLCAEKGQRETLGYKLAFSRSEGSFCTLRYVPRRMVPWLLRSQNEVAVLKRLQHPNVVRYHECLLDPEHGGHYMVLDHVPRGAIMDSTELEGDRHFAEDDARRLIRHVIHGLQYLHSLRIVHGDIRPDHILRCADGSVKINPLGCITLDFTDVTDMKALVRARLGDASSAFLAPELCWLCEGPQALAKSYATDVWAVGVMLYFMIFGRVPFGGRDEREIQENICFGKLRFPRVPESSKRVRGLIKSILERDPVTRIGMFELLNHLWFAEGATIDVPEGQRLEIGPEEVDGAVQIAKVRLMSRRRR